MAIGEVANALSTELSPIVDTLWLVAKIIAGVLSVWILIWLVNIFLNIKKTRLLKTLLINLEETNQKLDKLLAKKGD